jgi:hypothetical protein
MLSFSIVILRNPGEGKVDLLRNPGLGRKG